MIRVAFPTERKKGLEDSIYSRFGRSPYFTIVILDDEYKVIEVKDVENPGYFTPSGAGARSIQVLVDEKVTVIAAPSLGSNSAVMAQEMGIKHVPIPAGIKVAKALQLVINELKKVFSCKSLFREIRSFLFITKPLR
jgi:predicted Fe-Mo cluster-binding NifX family protein